MALETFLARFDGEFTLNVQEEEATFELEPDLSTIFDELPNNLLALKSAQRNVTLHF